MKKLKKMKYLEIFEVSGLQFFMFFKIYKVSLEGFFITTLKIYENLSVEIQSVEIIFSLRFFL